MKFKTCAAFLAMSAIFTSTTVVADKAEGMAELKKPAAVQVRSGKMLPEAERLAIEADRAKRDANSFQARAAAGQKSEIPNRLMPEGMDRKAIANDPDGLIGKKPGARALGAPTSRQSPAVGFSEKGYSQDDNTAVGAPNVAPPDTNGDVGQDYYAQYVNLGWVVFRKSDGSRVTTQIGNSFWTGFGGACENNNNGDPIVLYDHLADRWVFSQFAPNQSIQCFAVSQGDDLADDIANGNFALYEFLVSDAGGFNDYEKITIWTDADGSNSGYLMTHNEFRGSFAGVTLFWADRDAMIAGDANPAFRFEFLPDLGFPQAGEPTYFNLEPVHLEGFDLPPAGTCPLFVMATDWEVWNNGGAEQDDAYRFWRWCVDENTSDFSVSGSVTAPEFISSCNAAGFASTCADQPNGQQLDTLPQMTMYRFNARMLGGELVGAIAHNVQGGQDGLMSVRWATLNMDTTGDAHTLRETGNVDVSDGLDRSMGSAGLDADGNVGVVYTRSGSGAADFPSVYFAGKLAGETDLQAESVCVDGTGSQANVSRWGDYASVSIDPVDQCTFWVTQEYVETTGSFNWATRVCSFRFDECGDAGFFLNASNNVQDICGVTGGDLDTITVNVGQVGGFSGDVTLSFDTLPAGVNGSFSVNPVPAPGSSDASLSVDPGTAAGAYNFDILGQSAGADDRTASVTINVQDAIAGAPTLTGPADGATGVSLTPTFTWDGVAGADGYTIEIATDAGFTNIVETADVAGTEYTSAGLNTNTSYFWRVSASNLCGDGGFSDASSFSTGQLICSNPGLATIDNDSISDTLSVGDSGELESLNVSVNLPHTWVGDLQIALENNGTSILLLDRPGRDDTGFGCSSNNINNVFSDAGDLSAEDGCDGGTANDAYPADAILIPNEALAAFAGAELSGDWTLTVTDNAGGDGGSLDEWCLLPTLATAPGDFDGNGCVDVDDMALLIAEIRARTNNPDFDLNGDGRVNSRDRRVLIGLYTNPRGARCDDGGDAS